VGVSRRRERGDWTKGSFYGAEANEATREVVFQEVRRMKRGRKKEGISERNFQNAAQIGGKQQEGNMLSKDAEVGCRADKSAYLRKEEREWRAKAPKEFSGASLEKGKGSWTSPEDASLNK